MREFLSCCLKGDIARRGFTLIELSVVVALVAAAILVVAPRFTGVLRGRELLGAAGRMAGDLDYTRSRAVLEGEIFAFKFDRNKGQYWITGAAEEDERTSEDESRRFSLPTDISIVRIEKKSGGRDRYSPVIRFFPRGTADEAIIHLKDRAGERVQVHVKPYTGRSEVIRSRY